MNIQELGESFTTKAFVSKDLDSAASYMSEDFQFSGPVPEPVDKKQWLALMKVLNTAFPDMNYNTRILGVEGNVVRVTNQLTGTHTNDLDLSAMGLGVIPATGKSISNPEERGETTVKDNKVTSVHINAVEGGGLMGILKQLGVAPPQG
jgi:hypothetical protein